MQEYESKLQQLERIIDRHQERLFRLACLHTGSRPAAEDIVQDVMLRLFRSESNLSHITDLESYLIKAIINRCRDYHRQGSKATLPLDQVGKIAVPTEDPTPEQEYERIYRLLERLPEEQAEVIRLKTSESMTFAQIAELTESSEATVKSRFRYGIQKLRTLIAGASH